MNNSKVPFFTFSENSREQEQQLADNPLIKRFVRSRQAFSADPFRPAYHFVNPEGLLNDPNGLCFWRGKWHLFYQAFPPEDPRQHWGHAVSSDLVHWRDLPYAIYPGPEDKCYSGAAFVEDDRVIAMYFGQPIGNMTAESRDPLLLNWKKLADRPVIPALASDPMDPDPAPYRVFDPCIWKKGDLYYSLSGGCLPHRSSGNRLRAEFLFRSRDLINWEYLHPFIEDDIFGRPGDDGACPYFWPIGDKHILLHFSHVSGSSYLLGDYDQNRDKFIPAAGGDFTFGSWYPGGVHAPSAFPDGSGGLITIFNINSGKPVAGWNQLMSLPRKLTLLSDLTLGQEPAGDLRCLRKKHTHVPGMELPANREIILEQVRGNVLEIEAEINPKEARMIELNVLRSPGREEYTRIVFYKQRGFRDLKRWKGGDPLEATESLVMIDTGRSSELPDVISRPPETGPFFLEPGEPVKLRIFIDRSVMEVFVNSRQCIAVRVYPGRKDSTSVSIRAQGGPAEVIKIDAWELKTIYY
jgi:beta-fructofuranosidase